MPGICRMRGLQLVDSWSSRPGEPLAGLPKCVEGAGQKEVSCAGLRGPARAARAALGVCPVRTPELDTPQLCWVFSDFLLLAVLHPSALPGSYCSARSVAKPRTPRSLRHHDEKHLRRQQRTSAGVRAQVSVTTATQSYTVLHTVLLCVSDSPHCLQAALPLRRDTFTLAQATTVKRTRPKRGQARCLRATSVMLQTGCSAKASLCGCECGRRCRMKRTR